MAKKKSRQPAAAPTNQKGNKNKTENAPAAPAQSKQPKKQKNAMSPQPGSAKKVPIRAGRVPKTVCGTIHCGPAGRDV